MTTPKCMVCTCEDVSDIELKESIALGYHDLESLKRFTGLGTGPCQGKACITLTRRILAEATGVPESSLGAITFRPPVRPVQLRYLAGEDAAVAGPVDVPSDEHDAKPGSDSDNQVPHDEVSP